MIIIDMSQLRHGRTEDEAQAAVRRLLFPYLQPAEDEPHTHTYAIGLLDQDNGSGVELTAFEAPCPNGDAANHVRRLLATLRELADEVEAAHADLLAEDEETLVEPAEVIRDLLLVVGVTVSEETVKGWDIPTRRAVQEWASATHLAASDNEVTVPPRPAILDEAELGEG